MAWSLGPPAVQCTWRTAPGFRRSSSLASLHLALCHDARSDHTPSTPIEHAFSGTSSHGSRLADTTQPGQRRHQVRIGQLWERQAGHQLQQQQQQRQQQQQQQEQQKSLQQRPRHYHHHSEPAATNFKNQQWRQQHHQFDQGPDALMRAIMEATTVRQLQSVVHADLQAYINDDGTSPLTPVSAKAAKPEAASGTDVAVLTTRMTMTMMSTTTTTTTATTTMTTRSALWNSGGLPRMRPIHVAAAIVRLSKLPYNSNSDVPAFTREPGDQSASQQTSEDHGQQLLKPLLQLACSQAGALTARQLVNVIWALARMEADMARDGGAGGDVSRSGMHLAATAAAAATPSIGQLEVLVSELLGQRVQLWRWEDGKEGENCCVEEEGEDRVSERNSLGALALTFAVGKVPPQTDAGLTPPALPPPPPPALPPRSIGKLAQASNREVANLAWAAAQLRLRSPPLWTAVRREAEVRLQKRRAERAPSVGDGSQPARVPAPATGSGCEPFNAADLANLSWALARAGELPGGALAELLVHAAMEQIEEFDAVSLAGLIWGLGTLAANTLPAALTRDPALHTHHGNDGGGGGGGDDDDDGGGGVLADLLPLLLQRATPRVVSELAQQRMRPQEVALADYVTSNTPAFVGCDNRRTVGGGGVRHVGLDNLANVLLALVRCVEARADGGGGQYTDSRVARRVERALESAARQVVLRNLPGASPESLTALAVAFSNRVTGREGTGGSSATASADAATEMTAAPAALGTESPNDLIAASSSGLLPPSPSLAGPVVPPIRATVLRALLRAAVRLLPALPLPSSPQPPRHTEVSAAVGDPDGGGGRLRPGHMREIVGVLWWCIQGLGGGADGAAEELRLAAPWVERALPLCRPADLALLAALYARAGCHPASLEAAISAATRSAASAMSPLDISQLAWAAATASAATVAKAGPNTAAVAAGRDALLISVLELRATELLRSGAWPPGQELAILSWSFAKLNHYSEPFLDAVAMVLRPAHGAILTPAVPSARQAKAPSATVAAAASGAVASARLESPTLLEPLLRLSPHEVAMVAAALGQLRYFDSVLMRSLAARVEADVGHYSGRVRQ
ncbi:hypothetical protein Vafri_6217 [Volvox africanus]|uniref:Uncharacterized protein n=1 Tax=Volvox africanus TaxID=51714 RepID=A0A8J4AXJ8_9CHLO|nr:hypothetical protein Vafri_6217 [Volvox africanus]